MSSMCRLCRTPSVTLKESHVIPSFVGRYLKGTSATGFLAAVNTSGKSERAQDLYKTHLLCGGCEQRIGKHETFVAENIFQPYKENSLESIPANEHLAKFAVSVSLRALWVLIGGGDPLAQKWHDILMPLEREWREYLLADSTFIKGKNSHHLLLSSPDLLVAGLKTSPNLVLSIFRSTAWYIDEQFGKAFFFANMASMQTISMISPAEFPVSRGTQVYPKQTFGIERPCRIGWGGYFQTVLALSQKFETSGAAISDKHKAMIKRSIEKDPKRVLQSEDHQIMEWQRARLREQGEG